MFNRLRAFTALSIIVLATGLGACGGSDSPEDQAVDAVETAYGAAGDGDAETFCGELSSDYRADFEDDYGACDEAALDAATGGSDSGVFDDPQADAVDSYEYDGSDVVEVAIGGGDGDDSVEVVDEGGEWRLDDFDVPGGD